MTWLVASDEKLAYVVVVKSGLCLGSQQEKEDNSNVSDDFSQGVCLSVLHLVAQQSYARHGA